MTGPMLFIAGPTASGKSALAIRAARAFDGEIVNADSMQIYADLRLLSARPSPQEEAQAPHHLFGLVDGADGWSVGRWLRAVTPVLADIQARGRRPVLVGGTGLYFRALTEGLADIPDLAPEIRTAAEAVFDRDGETAVRAILAGADPAGEVRIAPGDRQRLVRALEVLEGTGRSMSDWRDSTRPTLAPDAWRGVVIEPPRAELYRRCDARLDAMVETGALDEVRALVARGLDPLTPVMKAVGVPQLAAHLAGDATLEAALDDARRETRRYAKRQMTWLRNQTPDWPRIVETDQEAQWRQFLALNPSLTPSV
ncbi:MAG: tRNA (adenosine(37)-N6)-dimethylallyltransferase MiaA [Caulobacter sp.]|nr:tRNA (adenosine(37)-N6)-dimethylallyltransferase MiaA [Caulobacter sp.]